MVGWCSACVMLQHEPRAQSLKGSICTSPSLQPEIKTQPVSTSGVIKLIHHSPEDSSFFDIPAILVQSTTHRRLHFIPGYAKQHDARWMAKKPWRMNFTRYKIHPCQLTGAFTDIQPKSMDSSGAPPTLPIVCQPLSAYSCEKYKPPASLQISFWNVRVHGQEMHSDSLKDRIFLPCGYMSTQTTKEIFFSDSQCCAQVVNYNIRACIGDQSSPEIR